METFQYITDQEKSFTAHCGTELFFFSQISEMTDSIEEVKNLFQWKGIATLSLRQERKITFPGDTYLLEGLKMADWL